MLKNNKGFSLIELMVVVAIIGLLASFAIPQYSAFQAKARQKEGLALLNSYYTASKATEADAGFAFGNFVAIGFAPSGVVHYRVTAVDNGTNDPTTGSNDNGCVDTQNATTCNCGGTCATFKTWTEAPVGGTFGPDAPSGCAAAITPASGAFTTCASATIRSNAAADVDTWSINQGKVVTNTNDGIN